MSEIVPSAAFGCSLRLASRRPARGGGASGGSSTAGTPDTRSSGNRRPAACNTRQGAVKFDERGITEERMHCDGSALNLRRRLATSPEGDIEVAPPVFNGAR